MSPLAEKTIIKSRHARRGTNLKPTIALVIAAIISGFVFVAQPTAEATGCTDNDPSGGNGNCFFSCLGDTNTVGTSISAAWWTGGIGKEARAYCHGALSAICSTQATSCTGNGGGVYGNGQCVGHANAWIDFALGCVANSQGTQFLRNVAINLYMGVATATACDQYGCMDVPVECIWGAGVACGVGTTAAQLQAMFPNL